MDSKQLIAAAAAFAITGVATAVPIIDEDFESYADSAAMQAVWTGTTGTLDTAFGNTGQSMAHPGGTVNIFSFANQAPTDANPLFLSGMIYDDGLSSNERVTIGLRDNAGSNIIEMGHYNNPSHFAYRTVLFGSGDSGWVAFSNVVDDNGDPLANASLAGWHTYTATVGATFVNFTLDLNSDGNINATASTSASYGAGEFNAVRLGGPSNLSSGGGGVNYDNILLETIPEPGSLALLGLGGLAMLRRRRA